MRRWIALACGVAILVAVNWTIHGRERLIAGGDMVLLQLAPVDPRSLMQGDYMALRFALAGDIRKVEPDGGDGYVLVALDADRVGSFARLGGCAERAAGELCLRYRVRDGRVQIATDAFFFQEGEAALYQGARYGEFRVGGDGTALLVAMRGPDRARLGTRGESRENKP